MDEVGVLIVEDNRVVQRYLAEALALDPGFRILDTIDDGYCVLDRVKTLQPGVILLDLFLHGMDGLDVIAEVMAQAPCPIVVISSELDRSDQDLAFEAQRLGAVHVMAKPVGMSEEAFRRFASELIRTVRVMSRVKVTRRRAPLRTCDRSVSLPATMAWDLLLIGSSTGGPAALHKLLSALRKPFPFSIMIAQHIISGFSDALCTWLASTGCTVRVPADGAALEPGIVYLAADDMHLVLGAGSRLRQLKASERFSPSVDLLFESAAKHFPGRMCAMVLTGMGDDGARGIRDLHKAGALTIAEGESSCVIASMPNAARATGAVRYSAPLDDLAAMLAAGGGQWPKNDCPVTSQRGCG